jgi:hypothetical protein
MKRLLYITIFCIALFHSNSSIGQVADSSITQPVEIGLFPKKDPGGLKKINVSGFYRFLGNYTRQLDPYLINQTSGETVLKRNIFIGDDSQLPNLSLNVSGSASTRSSWGFDLYVFQFMTGAIAQTTGSQVADSLRPNIQFPLTSTRLGSSMGLQLGLNLYGSFNTKYGDISARIGGIQWYAMSDLTMASFKGYNRFMLFERSPWDPTGMDISSRYNQYYAQGSIDQDTRWGNRAFVGALIEGSNLPGRLSFTVLAGKTELNGGFSQVPNYSYGGKLRKDFGSKNFIAVNTINSLSFTDSLAREQFGFNMATVELNLDIREFIFKGELGGGNYFSPNHDAGWSEALQLKVTTPRRKNIPLFELHYFRISPDVINNNAVFWNTARAEYSVNDIPAGSVGSSALLQPFGSSMVRVGQMTNNRQGLDLNIEASVKKLKFSGGLGFSSEIEPAAAIITYSHPVNQFTRSRFWRWNFPAGVGPYNRYSDIFRDAYETVNLSDDSSGVVVNKKHFANMEGQFKYSTKLAGKELFIFSILQMNTAQRDFSPVVVTTEKAYIRQYTAEFELYYRISRTVLINGYYGYERTLGNYLTDIDEVSRRPRNQYGEGVGTGFDIDLGKNARLYVRHRWYYFRDESFSLDRFRGRELTVELKAFF